MVACSCPYSLKDRVLVFGTSDGGSIPPGGTLLADGVLLLAIREAGKDRCRT